MELLHWLLLPIGLFTVALGTLHFFFPYLLDFRHAIPLDGPALTTIRWGPVRFTPARGDVRGIAWVMNHAVSYTLVSIGLVDLFGAAWLASTAGRVMACWIAGWWFIRALAELHLGRRLGDWIVVLAFGGFGVVHLLLAFGA
jgi:hypothetical protein